MTTDDLTPHDGPSDKRAKTGGRRMETGLEKVTHDHLLRESVKITQPADGYRVGTDAVLLAASVNTPRGRILDMGAGVGGVCLCVAHRLPDAQITAIEKNPDMVKLAGINIADNGFEDQIRLINGDITTMPAVLAGSFDHVISNPPYHDIRGTRPRNKARAMAHMGDDDTRLEDWVKAAIWAAKPRAKISFICRADRASELITLFDRHGAGETLLFPLWPRHNSPAGRVIVQVRRGVEGPGAILPGLVIHNDNGGFTEIASRVIAGDALFVVHPARPQVTPTP